MTILDLEQGSDEWLRARLGKVTGSKVSDVLAKGAGKTRAKYLAQLVAERLTGKPTETFKSAAMDYGSEHEEKARIAYRWHRGLRDEDIQKVGFVLHPTIEGAGASPDAFVGEDGGVEIKMPETHTHLDYLLRGEKAIPKSYRDQIQWNMACSGRQWWDFVSYDFRLPEDRGAYFRHRFERDGAYISEMETEVSRFLIEVEATIVKIDHKVGYTGEGEGLDRLLAAG